MGIAMISTSYGCCEDKVCESLATVPALNANSLLLNVVLIIMWEWHLLKQKCYLERIILLLEFDPLE